MIRLYIFMWLLVLILFIIFYDKIDNLSDNIRWISFFDIYFTLLLPIFIFIMYKIFGEIK
jgi:hypothetical protein